MVLLSGGLDSTTVLAIARQQGYTPYAITFQYGQRHAIEIDAARQVAQAIGVAGHVIVECDVCAFGGSTLTSDLEVPKDRSLNESGIPVTYVPARNTIILSFALAWAETLVASDIFLGVNAIDYSGYPDCRPEYLRAFEAMANLATRAGVKGRRLTIHAPLIALTKAEIIRTGLALGVDYGLTHSCYDPASGRASCGYCDSCRLRLAGFSEAGANDPVPYATVASPA